MIKVGSHVKLYHILHVFGPKFFRWQPPNFWTCIIKLSHILIMWQSFAVMAYGAWRSYLEIIEINKKNINIKT